MPKRSDRKIYVQIYSVAASKPLAIVVNWRMILYILQRSAGVF